MAEARRGQCSVSCAWNSQRSLCISAPLRQRGWHNKQFPGNRWAYLAALLIAAAVVWPSAGVSSSGFWLAPSREIHDPPTAPTDHPPVPAPLTDPGLDLRVGPVDVPLELRIPSLQIKTAVVGVGITAENVMDAPKGLAADPVWQQAFWYRGSGIPGAVGTATFAGHVDDLLGRPAVFARLKELQTGDLILVRDTRSGLDVRFTVVRTATYSAREAADPAVLAQICGEGPVAGKAPQPAADGRAHLTLITCAGSVVDGAYDRRLVVYATRSESK